ncbi:hypothetical protein LHGZ1_1364 [Laribacter hongkongensis]|uniref:Uncharacterized protein n=1 Tax=Laribacter hongkongensis TaxID=168471 RepID=A0A248LI40_9NEIS|nr:hypothetical protein LHGZ1_1364 [Laribacter hongkongensis]
MIHPYPAGQPGRWPAGYRPDFPGPGRHDSGSCRTLRPTDSPCDCRHRHALVAIPARITCRPVAACFYASLPSFPPGVRPDELTSRTSHRHQSGPALLTMVDAGSLIPRPQRPGASGFP